MLVVFEGLSILGLLVLDLELHYKRVTCGLRLLVITDYQNPSVSHLRRCFSGLTSSWLHQMSPCDKEQDMQHKNDRHSQGGPAWSS